MSLISGDKKRSSGQRKHRIAQTEKMRALRKLIGANMPVIGKKVAAPAVVKKTKKVATGTAKKAASTKKK